MTMVEDPPKVAHETTPVADPSGSVAKTSIRQVIAHGLVVFVVGVLVVVLYLFVGTSFVHNREQAALRRTFSEQGAAVGLPPQYVANASTGAVDLTRPKVIPRGAPVAWVRIPHIDVSEVVVEGSGASQTLQGPGHVSSTPLPGQFGNSVLVCRRLTGGAPCGDLDEVRIGNAIDVTTKFGVAHYKVFGVGPANEHNAKIFGTLSGTAAGSKRNTLTVVTSDPSLTASQRLVVQAELQGTAVNYTPNPIQVGADQLGLSGESGAWLPLVLSMQLLLLGSLGAAWLLRRWHRGAAWCVGAPFVLALAWLVCAQLLRVLPGAL